MNLKKCIDHFLFYSDRIENGTIVLDSEETHHAFSVLRAQQGHTIFVTDGKGHIFEAEVTAIDKRVCVAVAKRQRSQLPSLPAVHFFIGLPEKDAFESALCGLIPLGVIQIVPVECSYCQKDWWSRNWEKHMARFIKKMVGSAKQSWNAWLPTLQKPVAFSSVMNAVKGALVVAHQDGERFDELRGKMQPVPDTLCCFVGPPGGFSPQENEMFLKKGAHCVKLSEHRLRTELAATVLAGNVAHTFFPRQ